MFLRHHSILQYWPSSVRDCYTAERPHLLDVRGADGSHCRFVWVCLLIPVKCNCNATVYNDICVLFCADEFVVIVCHNITLPLCSSRAQQMRCLTGVLLYLFYFFYKAFIYKGIYLTLWRHLSNNLSTNKEPVSELHRGARIVEALKLSFDVSWLCIWFLRMMSSDKHCLKVKVSDKTSV